MGDHARAFWIPAPGHGEIRTEPLPIPTSSEVLVRALYSGISRGTEALVFNGRVPVSEYGRMRAPFQAGEFPGPVKYGYASVGIVEEGPAPLQGRSVFVLYPHQTRYVVPVTAVHLLPEGLPARRAVLAANLETAVNGLWDASPQIGDRIVVIGGGTVGCLVAYLARRIPGTTVQIADTNRQRAGIAAALGVEFCAPDAVRGEADVVVHASGSSAGLTRALDAAGFEATVVELSWYGTQTVALPLGGAFHAKRLTIKSSQVGTVAQSRRSRVDTRRRMALALDLLADPVLDRLVTGESPFEELPEVMQSLASGPGDTLCHAVRYSQ